MKTTYIPILTVQRPGVQLILSQKHVVMPTGVELDIRYVLRLATPKSTIMFPLLALANLIRCVEELQNLSETEPRSLDIRFGPNYSTGISRYPHRDTGKSIY